MELGRNLAHETLAYVGPLDLMYHIVTLAAVKIGHTVRSVPSNPARITDS